MSDPADFQSTFDNSFFKAACNDVLRIVSILSLDSTDVTRPRHKQTLALSTYERFIFLGRFFYMVFIKGFTPTVFDILPYTLWRAITVAIYIYRLVVLPFWLRLTGYGKYADWTNLGSKQPAKNSPDSKTYPHLQLSKKGRLSKTDFGDEKYEFFLSKLYQLTTHLSPHSQSPGNPFVHDGLPGNFFDHLTGVYKILLAWKQPQYVIRAGLFHSVYGTFDYRYSLFDLRDGRQALTDIVGPGAEELAFALCTSDRLGLQQDLTKAMYGKQLASMITVSNNSKSNTTGDDGDDADGNPCPPRLTQLTAEGFPVRNHITQVVHVLPPDFFAQFVLVTIADFMEQGAIGFGSADDDICFFQFMRYRFFNDMIMFVKPFLRVVPPVWEKYMGDKTYKEPTRKEVIILRKLWIDFMKDFKLKDKKQKITPEYQYFLANAEEKAVLEKAVKKYNYLAEPRILLAATKTTAFPSEKQIRKDLVEEARTLLEEWGMLTIKSGGVNGLKSVSRVLEVLAGDQEEATSSSQQQQVAQQ